MDKYQKFLITNGINYFGFATNNDLQKLQNVLSENKITLTQNEDIAIKNYTLYIAGNMIEKIVAVTKGKEIPFKKELDPEFSSPKSEKQYRFYLPIDFDDKIESAKIVFANNLADDLIIPIEYVEADKEKYYAKKEQERKDNLLKTAEIKVATGADLVNIYFQPCRSDYDHTEISLFIPKEFVTVGGPYGPIQKPSSWSMIKKFNVAIDDYYLSVTGLAYGKYAIILKQYDRNSNVILETDYIEFSIYKHVNQNNVGKVNVF